MNRGIILKSVRELLPLTLMLGLGLALIEGVLAYVLPTFATQFSAQVLDLEFMRNIFSAMLGADVSEGIALEMFAAIAWLHPVVLAIVWAHALMVCTRIPAGEVDRGTIDLLLGQPVSRGQVMRSETLVWMTSGIVLLSLAFLGNVIGSMNVAENMRPEVSRLPVVLVNLFALYLAVGALAWLISALSDRRGWAIAIVFVILLLSFLLNYLTRFWEVADRLSFLSVLEYHRPLLILRGGGWPWKDLAVLFSLAAILWTAGLIIFTRRDLSTL